MECGLQCTNSGRTQHGRNNTAQLPCWAKIVAPRQTLLQLHLLPLPLATPLLHLQFFPLRSLIAAFTSRCRVRSSCTSHFFHRIVVEAQLLVARLSPERIEIHVPQLRGCCSSQYLSQSYLPKVLRTPYGDRHHSEAKWPDRSITAP